MYVKSEAEMKCKCGSSWECVCPTCHQWTPTDEWISVEDRFPPDCESVLVWCKGMTPTSAYLIYTSKNNPICYMVNDWDESDETIRIDDVTHWMPLPAAPKEER